MKYLLDTNVFSEFTKKRPEPKVLEFIAKLQKEQIFISCISVGELKKGIASSANKDKTHYLNEWFNRRIAHELKDQIVNLDFEIMCEWGILMSQVKDLPNMDSLIAATCLTHNLHLVTRNVKDFAKIKQLKIINPWN